MPAAATQVHVTFVPKWGPRWSCIFHVPGAVIDPNNAAVQAVVTAINNVTTSVAIEIALSVIQYNSGSAVAAADYLSEDKAQFRGLDDDGQAHNYKIPGMKPAILNTDKESINLANALVLAYINAVTANATGPGGQEVNSITEGHRTENRKRLKSGALY